MVALLAFRSLLFSLPLPGVMLAQVDWHDRYPKPDLDGGYLGDGYPLCSDLSPRSFLSKGARYNFVGKDVNGYLEGEGALNLSLAR